ncbi:PAS domain S-box protein [Candidatus Bathyarchaeota archaeon]|nr:PAS domain S-box protein [Candidatus Bathyarchaeota archaeon]
MAKVTVESANEVYIDLCREKIIKVLHVDDEAGFLAVAKQCLEEQSQFQVDTALSPKEAMEKLKRSEYDAIVSDYQMPEKNGLELLRELRQQGNDTPFILFTCKGKEEIAIEALNSGVYRYVGKEGNAEVTYEELKRSICDAVKGQRSEKLLKEAENRLRQITENMQDLLLLLDENLVIKYASSSYKSVVGYSPSEIIGKRAYDFVHPDDLPEVIETTKKAFKNKSTGRFESRVRRADGSYVLLEGIGKSLVDENGKVIGAVMTSRDITDRRKIEQTLRESEGKYRKLFDEVMDAIFVADAETGILIDCNRAATELTGKAKSELMGMHQRFLHPETERKGKFSETFAKHRADKEGHVINSQIVTKNGEIIDAVIKGSLVEVNGKKMLQGIFRDVTERKKVEEKIRFQARLLNAIGQAVTAADIDGKIIYWNHAAEQLYGWTEAEVLGRNIMKNLLQDIFQQDAQGVLSHLSGNKSWTGEAILKRRDGTALSVIVTTSPITNDEGEIIGILGVSTDITEQKWMQEIFNEAIAKVVELNEKLQVVESLTRHDIRNKLSALNGRIFLLKKRLRDNTEALSHLKEVEIASQQILRIMEFEKNYVQVGSEELKNIAVERYVAEAALLFSDLKGAKLINECSGLTVIADSMLRQLLYNMMDNTLKYGEKTSRIRVHYKEEEDQLKLIYEDDGVGISDEEKSKLFQEGYGKGTGFGLYLIKRICEGYGWKIQETGKHGKGVQFTMTIPKNAKDGTRLYEIS